ncbi:sensor histidine kinase [Clostridium sp. 'deep sea']|uniref:sensor histidine kinase n=1 Tax=Clostridium sp. 'deep sea' TaxID=2779445 RepID=UPI0018968683|nr:sensor histidine kinase [Clostridium sp. 'deep sea']QOR36762.1 sensor histidine kinase [Clostridium sp. 'deep sea']
MNKFLNYIKILILAAVIIIQQITTTSFNHVIFVVLVLAFILNHQIRLRLKNDSSFIITILIDLAIVAFLVYNFSINNSLLLLISSVDVFTYKNYNYALTLLLAFCYTTLNILNYNATTLVSLLFFYTFLITQLIISKQHSNNIKLNYLYDDIRKYSYELERAKAQIERYSAQVSELSTIKERNRIAEDIHDSVGHQLTSLLFRLQACEIELKNNKEKGLIQLTAITETLRNNLVLLRNKVKNVEVKSYSNFNNTIVELLEEFKKDKPFKISFSMKGHVVKLSPEIETVLFNNIRESLTNAAKHSNGDEIAITIMYKANNIVLTFVDNGNNSKTYKVGYGLRAMQNRTTLLNGSMTIINEQGFLLKFIIPFKEN